VRSVRAAVVSLLLIVPLLSSCASDDSAASVTAGAGATCSYPQGAQSAAKPVSPPSGIEPNTGSATVKLSLTGGDVTIAMDRTKTPCTIGSFVHLATAGYFNGTPCHRLTTSASLKVLQCGDPTGQGSGGPGYQFDDETDSSMKYPAGTVAMANSGANTNGSQFFLVYADSTLPPNYTVFGKITGGLDVLTKIAAKGVKGGGTDGAPAAPITITKVAVS
jgi:peptidyl-prolyl cis-trans isomerase B (cyclophilin B)